MTDIFLHKPFTSRRSKEQPVLSHLYRQMHGGTASDKSEIPFSGFGKPKSVLTSAPMPIKLVS